MQTGIDGARYAPLAPSTLKGRFPTSGKIKKVRSTMTSRMVSRQITSRTRMYVTHGTAVGAFNSAPFVDGVKVFVKNQKHPFYDANYDDIIGWNSAGQDTVNDRLKLKAPLIFPVTPEQIEMIREPGADDTIVNQALRKIEADWIKQAKAQFPASVKHDLTR